MKFEIFMALKYLVKGRREGFASLIAFISVLGIAVGVMALIVVLSVMNGFDRELKSKIVGIQPHIRIEGVGGVSQVEDAINTVQSLGIDGIVSIAPYVEGQAIIRSDRNAVGIVVKGIDQNREALELFKKHMEEGTLEFSDVQAMNSKGKPESVGRIVLGGELAKRLGVGIGDTVILISPAMEEESLKKVVSKARNLAFSVSGIYRIGMNDFDSGLALFGLSKAQELYGLGDRATGIGIRLSDPGTAERAKRRVQEHFGNAYVVQSWVDMNRTFFGALQVEKTVMTILLSLIILVAAFNIISTLVMLVKDKTKDIGILRAIGATRSAILRIFLVQGFVVGLIGVMLGAVLGLLLASNLNPVSDFLKHHFGVSVFPSDIYYFDRIPSQIQSSDVSMVVFYALLMSVLAGWYPALYASRLSPVRALRYE